MGGVLLLTYCNVCVAAAPSDVQPPLLSVFSSRPPGCAGLGGWDEFFLGGGVRTERWGREDKISFPVLGSTFKKAELGEVARADPAAADSSHYKLNK